MLGHTWKCVIERFDEPDSDSDCRDDPEFQLAFEIFNFAVDLCFKRIKVTFRGKLFLSFGNDFDQSFRLFGIKSLAFELLDCGSGVDGVRCRWCTLSMVYVVME